MKVCSLVILILLSLSACESEEPPTGMPRCEPEGELLIERDLKSVSGFEEIRRLAMSFGPSLSRRKSSGGFARCETR